MKPTEVARTASTMTRRYQVKCCMYETDARKANNLAKIEIIARAVRRNIASMSGFIIIFCASPINKKRHHARAAAACSAQIIYKYFAGTSPASFCHSPFVFSAHPVKSYHSPLRASTTRAAVQLNSPYSAALLAHLSAAKSINILSICILPRIAKCPIENVRA